MITQAELRDRLELTGLSDSKIALGAGVLQKTVSRFMGGNGVSGDTLDKLIHWLRMYETNSRRKKPWKHEAKAEG